MLQANNISDNFYILLSSA